MIQPPQPIAVKPGYKPQSEDTSIESDVYQFYLLRQKSAAERWKIAADLIRWSKAVSLRGMKQAKGSAVTEHFAKAVLEEKWLPALTPTSDSAMWIQDPSDIARLLHPIFEQLQVPYYITGGVAAIAYGDPRTTRDLDLVIEIEKNTILALVSLLEQAGFYVPPGAVEDIIIGRGRTLSVTHIERVLNADIVINNDTPFDQSKMARRRLVALDLAGNEQFWVASPDDVILAKLQWGKRSQSEKQWRDVLGILKVQVDNLDYRYLTDWAERLGLLDDLQRALTESGT